MAGCRRYFFGMGIERYAFQPLDHAASDTDLVRESFGGICYKTRTALPDVANRQEWKRELEAIRTDVDEGTEAVVAYFDVHAVAVNGRVRVLFRDAQSFEDTSETAGIFVEDLWEHFLTLPIAEDALIMLIFVCCRSHVEDHAWEQACHPRNRPQVHQSRARMSIWSCAAGSEAHHGRDGARAGPMARSLERHLREGEDLSPTELYERVEKDVVSFTKNSRIGVLPQQPSSTTQGAVSHRKGLFVKPAPGSPRTCSTASCGDPCRSLITSASSGAPAEAGPAVGRCPRPRCLPRRCKLALLLLAVLSVAAASVPAVRAVVSLPRGGKTPADCRWGPWSDVGPCSASCGGGRVRRCHRLLGPPGVGCPGGAGGGGQQCEDAGCSQQACPVPSGCCKTCDLRCDAGRCEALVAMDEGAGSCTFEPMAKALGSGVLTKWYGQVLGNRVRWQWRFSCQSLHCVIDRKRMVKMTELRSGWSTEEGDYTHGWDDSTKAVLDRYAEHLGFSVNASARTRVASTLL